MARVDPQVKALLAARLGELRASGRLSTAIVREAARGLGISERTVWGWVAARPDGLEVAPSAGYRLSEADLDAFADWRGNVAAVHRALHAGRPGGLSLRRLQHAFRVQLTPGQRAGMVEGAEGRRRFEVYLRWDPPERNAMWEADHVELPVLVLAPRAQRPGKPWATLFIDAYSRLIMGWAISMRPTSGVVLAALRAGIVVDPARGPFGGVPAVLRPDHGLEFTATALRRSCAALGIELVPAPTYTPHAKGKVERVNRTLVQLFLSGLPFFTGGPRGRDGSLHGPDTDPMTLGLFVERFAGWVAEYNTERIHSSLAVTPLARWSQDATPLRELAPQTLRWMLMADVERVVGRDGVHFEGVRFLAPELNGLVGERVQVRYSPHDLRQVELFRGDRWLATAYPQDTLSEEQRAAVLARRRADAVELGRRQRRTSRRARAQLAPATAPGQIEDATVVTAAAAREDRSHARRGHDHPDDAALRRLARTNLLDLKTDFAFWNPDLAVAAAAELDPAAATAAPPAATPALGEDSV
ncbi:Mu transposase C-terminal domain-containing protein [Actinomycetospora soli]|uniref:Mu transposase C-terminal domain-containing protein n=1 Tax=Actinomycetospora soli TaxID=2893887 RepID=UPI001E5A927F|nr:Mu transposase C-terminal domain-containing protein [Actinomycetospora soli]MCD2191689.1 Mu transposase C-terminal domain-containing protein [Actinomycetospora soli]